MLREGDNMMGVKRVNRSAALHILHEQGGMSRKHLSETIRLTPAAITKIVGELIEEGIVKDGRLLPGGGAGRREVMVELDERSRCALGLLINLRQAIVSAVWLDGSVIFSEEIELIPAAPAEATVKMLCERLMALTEEHIREKERILGVGIAIRGITSFDGRVVLNSFGALNCSDYPLAQRVEEYTGYSAVMSNNVRALFAAQMFLSKERELHSQFFLRCEYGIGASLSINDRIWLGGTNQCSEIGHIPVIRRGGKPCSCGKSGCLETIASPAAIREDAICILSPDKTPVLWKTSLVRGRDALTVEDVLEAASCGDSGAAEIVDRAVSALSAALKSVIYIIDPAKIVLYGRMFENDFYLTRLLAELQEGVDAGHHITTEKSAYNQLLEDRAAGLLVIEDFIDNGGMQ
ncbi:MAG: ROK family transcriptional regulator [Eubacteriales bacterium]|nr:ROK family transcriptional regulator [Eubacteriales bacterium]